MRVCMCVDLWDRAGGLFRWEEVVTVSKAVRALSRCLGVSTN